MSNTARPKFATNAPAFFSDSDPENPRKEYKSEAARPSGSSGGGEVDTPHRVSSRKRGARPAKKASRRRG
jgi:hypothetical protein